MKLQQFTGGKATKLRPQYLQLNEGVEYTNIDNRVGTLAPVKDKTLTNIDVSRYHTYYIAQAQWVSSEVRTDYVEFQKILYSTDRVTQPQKFDGTNTYNLGIEPPPKLPFVSRDDHPAHVSELTLVTDNDATGLPLEDTYYLAVNTNGNEFSTILQMLVSASGRTSIVAYNSTSLPVVPSLKSGSTDERTIEIKDLVLVDDATLYGVDVYRRYKGTYYLVGSLPTDVSTLLDNTDDISANTVFDIDKLGNLTGTLQYAMTYVDSATGNESALPEPSIERDLEYGGQISLTSLPVSTDPQVDKKRIYRIGNNLTAFTLVEEIDNATTSYIDNIKDTEVVGTIADTDGDGVAPIGLSFLVEAYAMLFGAIGPRLYFTEIGQPDNWPLLNFLNYEADITGIAPVANGLLVFTGLRTHLVTGTGPTALSTQLLSGDQGCLAYESIASLGGAAIWVSTDGMCTSSGDLVRVLTKDKLGKIEIDVADSVIHDEVYYVIDTQGFILAFDFGDGGIFKNLDLGISTLAVANDILYGWEDDLMYSLMTSDDNEFFSYTSPRFIEGRSTELKAYKKVYMYSKGPVTLRILIDDITVASGLFNGEDSYTIQVPVEDQRGFFIQFEVEGTGEVYELEYTVSDRKND